MDAEVISSELRDYEALRERLIDVSGRNRLLNFKSEGTSVGAGIRLIDNSFEAVFDHLMSEKPLMFASLPAADSEPPDEKTSQFQILLRRERQSDPKYLSEIASLAAEDTEERQKAERDLRDRLRAAQGMLARPTGRNPDLPGWAQVFGITPSFELPLRTETRTTSTARTLMLPETMEKRLLRLERSVRAVEQETGVSTLHLALGFLEWFESDSAGDPLASPLLLLPVALTHEKLANGSVRFHFSATDSDPQINLSLQFRLAADFRLELPKFDAEVNNPVATYIDSIHGLIRGRRRWKIRNHLTLAPFSFTRIAMYRDLDPVHWPANGGPAAHPLVRPILRGISDAPTDPDGVRVRHADLHNIDDPGVVQAAPILVHDADSSQHSALIDAMSGKNLAIQGPPGTGKSQTIANLIANALYRGKSILFVSEKMAALEVVKDRLDKVGLGEFCLTLHAAGSKPAAVMEALKRRDSLLAPRQVPRSGLPERMATAQATITRHLDTMHRELNHNGDTLHGLIGRIASYDSANPSLPRLMHSFISRVPTQIEAATVYDAQRSLADLESSTKVSGKDWQPSLSPFCTLDRGDLSVLEQEELFERMADLVVFLESTVIGLQSFHSLIGTDPAMRIGDMSDMLYKIELLQADAAAPDLGLLTRMTSRQAIKKVQAIANRIEALISARDHLASFPKLQHDSAGLRALIVAAQDMAVFANTVGEIRALARTAIARAATIKESREGIDAVVNFFQFDDATTLAEIRRGCVSLDHLHKIDPLAIQYRRHGLENHVTTLK
ncbi:DUF4011 domain-containing protein [Acidiphilium acidophilum]|uniref:DUF4011 domain-containing protein n=1 Tax=Acidiphilium acidophilum TaxID=76588 RepID=UPI002E8E7667|nr:DUF4011 domain-containing protein [Acidiphilium acidophilum]